MWGSGFIGAELGTRLAPADTLLAWRYVAAAVVVTTWAVVRGIRPDRRTWPPLVLVGGMLALSAGTLLERRLRLPVSLLESLTVQTLTSTAFFVTAATLDHHPTPPAAPQFWWAVLWVVALPTFGGYGRYPVVLRRSGATRVSTLLLLTPPTTALWAFLMFGTRPGLLALPGGAVCAVAVTLVVRRGRASRTR